MLNYDAMSFEDIDFYLNSRLNRRHYLSMMPLLHQIKKQRLEELKWESSFVQMMVGQVSKKISGIDVEANVWECINWWKLKNKWKRPIRKDDAKALRMIEKKVLAIYNKEK